MIVFNNLGMIVVDNPWWLCWPLMVENKKCEAMKPQLPKAQEFFLLFNFSI